MSCRRTVLSANCLSTNCPSAKCPCTGNLCERVRHALKAEAWLSSGRSDPSERLIIKNFSPSKLYTIALKSKAFENICLSSPERSWGTYFYTKQVYNTDQLHAFLKDPNAMHIYNTGAACLLVCPIEYAQCRKWGIDKPSSKTQAIINVIFYVELLTSKQVI